jgi:hypothetical protein
LEKLAGEEGSVQKYAKCRGSWLKADTLKQIGEMSDALEKSTCVFRVMLLKS